jgi:CUG-BP- and ETR3-like factor
MAHEDAAQEAVASEPKLFVGQVPLEATEEQLSEVMRAYGEVCHVTIPKKHNQPQTCRFAMVTFVKWAGAEAAAQALHGTTSLGGAKPLVVRFADPPRGDDSRGIVPKKLFVGQARLLRDKKILVAARIATLTLPSDAGAS